jgi:ABC-type transporter Mla subunit MlaD
MEELGGIESPNLILSNLTSAWPGLVRNLTMIHEMVAAAKMGNKELSDAFDGELQNLGRQLLLIISKLGERLETFNGASAFEAIASLDKEVHVMVNQAKTLEQLTITTQKTTQKNSANIKSLESQLTQVGMTSGATKQELADLQTDILSQVRTAIDPFIQLLGRVSTTKSDPGGLILNKVADLEREVVHLGASKVDISGRNQGVPVAPPTPAVASLAWSLAGPANAGLPASGAASTPSGSTATVPGEVAALRHRVLALEKKVSELEDHLSGETTVVAGAEFSSLTRR